MVRYSKSRAGLFAAAVALAGSVIGCATPNYPSKKDIETVVRGFNPEVSALFESDYSNSEREGIFTFRRELKRTIDDKAFTVDAHGRYNQNTGVISISYCKEKKN